MVVPAAAMWPRLLVAALLLLAAQHALGEGLGAAPIIPVRPCWSQDQMDAHHLTLNSQAGNATPPPLQAKETPGAAGQQRLHRRRASTACRRFCRAQRPPLPVICCQSSDCLDCRITVSFVLLPFSWNEQCEKCTADYVGCKKVGAGGAAWCTTWMSPRVPAAWSGRPTASCWWQPFLGRGHGNYVRDMPLARRPSSPVASVCASPCPLHLQRRRRHHCCTHAPLPLLVQCRDGYYVDASRFCAPCKDKWAATCTANRTLTCNTADYYTNPSPLLYLDPKTGICKAW